MRNSIYDYNGWARDSGMVPQEWEPGEAPGPYGDVPGDRKTVPEEPQSGRRTPDLRRGRKNRKPKAKKQPRPREKNGTGGFCFVLALMLILTGVAVYFQGGILPGEAPVERLPGWGRLPGWDRYYDYVEETDWREELDKTSISRAPLGESVLTLTDDEGTLLTPQEIYARVSPSVVGIRATGEAGMYMGTGVVMTADGYIITNAHVIAGTQKASAVFTDGSRAEALLVGYDAETDLAVLKVDRQGLSPAAFGDSALLQVGDPAYAIGNPLGEELRGTMTSGIISAIDRTVDMDGQSMTLIQTNAALNSGNSGGALINAAGQVVGITNMKMMSDWETIEGLGFAVPTAQAKTVVDQIISLGYYTGRPTMGIRVTNHYDADGNPDGAEVVSVKKQSAGIGKLFAGDVIISAQGVEVKCTDDLLRVKDWLIVGEEIHLQVQTGEGVQEVSFQLMRNSDLADSPELYTTRKGQ